MLTSDFKEFAALLNSNGVTVPVDGIALNFISLDDFKTNKKAVGRHRDLADLEALEQPPPPPSPERGGSENQ